jgi:hypothetical protein
VRRKLIRDAHATILALLTVLFSLRVLGQALVVFFSVDWLPSNEQWASGLIPYPSLLAIQVIMLAVMGKIVLDVWRETGFFATARPSWSRFVIRFSAIYAAGMVLRYVLTMTLRPEMRWLGGTLPIFFHFVLAGFLYTWGKFLVCDAIFARPDRAC